MFVDKGLEACVALSEVSLMHPRRMCLNMLDVASSLCSFHAFHPLRSGGKRPGMSTEWLALD